jgi:uncharacterized protein
MGGAKRLEGVRMSGEGDVHGFPLVLHKDADANSTGGVAVCGFSTVGMVGIIASSHIVKALNLTQLGTVIDREFPPVALVQNEVPKHPVRVYQGDGVGVFTSEIQFPSHTDVKFAETVLNWFVEGGFETLYVIDGIVTSDLADKEEGGLYGVSSSVSGRAKLKSAGIEPIRDGIVSGIAGWLLSEGDRRGLDVTALLAECNPMYPDARAAAIAAEAFSDMTDIEIPLDELMADARRIEENVRKMFEQQQNLLPAPDAEFEVDDDDDPMIG